MDKAAADKQYRRHIALVQAAAVRLLTAWEVFLRNLAEEYFERRPAAVARVLCVAGEHTSFQSNAVDNFIRLHRYPLQHLSRAKQTLLCEYMGEDIIGKGTSKLNLKAVEILGLIRNAIVHAGGKASKRMRDELHTRCTAHGYLLAKVGGTTPLAHTQFHQLVIEVNQAATDLYGRTWLRPRP